MSPVRRHPLAPEAADAYGAEPAAHAEIALVAQQAESHHSFADGSQIHELRTPFRDVWPQSSS